MSNYTYQTNFFGEKDFLPTGNPLKVILGEDFEREFVNIDVAIRTKMDLANPAFTGTLTGQGMTLLGNFSGDSADFTGDVTFGGSITGTPTGSIDLQASGTGLVWSQGDMWLSSVGGEFLASSLGKATLTSTTNNVEINASGGVLDLNASSFDFDATGPIEINGTSSLGMLVDLQMWIGSVNGGFLASAKQAVNITSADNNIALTAIAGVLDLNASSFDFDASTSINIKSMGTTTHVSDGYFSISAPNTNLGITAGNILDLNAGNFDLDSDNTIALNSVGVTNITANTGLFLTSTTTNVGITSTLGSVVVSANSGSLVLNAASFYFDATGPININGTTTANIASVGNMSLLSSAGTTTISASTGLTLGTTGGSVVVNANAGVLDLNASSFDFDATGPIAINGTTTANIASVGNMSLLSSAGTTTISASTGLTLGTTGGNVVVNANAGVLDLNASSFDFDATGPIAINGTTTANLSSVGTMALGSSTSTTTISAFTGLTLGTTGGSVVVNANAGVLDLNASSFDFDATGPIAINGTTTANLSSVGTMAIGSSTSTTTISAFTGLTLGTTGGSVVVNANAGVLDLNASSLDFDATGPIAIDGGGTLNMFVDSDLWLSSINSWFLASAKEAVTLTSTDNNIILNANAGVLDLNASSFDFDASTSINIKSMGTTTHVSDGYFSISAPNTNLGITAGNILDLNASSFDFDATGAIAIDGGGTLNMFVDSDLWISSVNSWFLASAKEAVTLTSTDNNIILNANAGVLDLNASSFDFDATNGINILSGAAGTTLQSTGDIQLVTPGILDIFIGKVKLSLPIYANNAAALATLSAGMLYRTSTGNVQIVY
jgi:hypothetical protein